LSQAAPCTEWDAGFSASAKSGKEARAVATTWTAVTECDDFSFHSYRVCWDKDTTTAPTSPAGADDCRVVLGLSASSKDLFIHRSEMDFGLRLFACQNAACTQYYGDGGGTGSTVANDDDSASTERLCFITEDVSDDQDDDRVLSTADYGTAVMAVDALMYPTGWTKANRLGLFWSHRESGEDVVKMKVADDTGWQNWNTYSSWSSDTLVAESGTGGATDVVTHPWVVASDDGSTKAVRLFVHAYDAGSGGPDQSEVYSADSTDEEGTDFSLECTDPGGCTDCAYGDFCDYSGASLAIDADGDAGDEYLDSAAHGRIMWDYVASGAVDFTSDSPGMLFSGDVQAGPTCTQAGSAGPDDIYRATWDSSGWAWDIEDDGTCPESMGDGDDQHDPAVTPLPGGEFMAFVKVGGDVRVYYWDPTATAWEDDRTIRVCFDSGADPCGSPTTDCTTLTTDCMANVASLVTHTGAPQGGIFFHVGESGKPYDGDTCASGLAAGEDKGVLYAKGDN